LWSLIGAGPARGLVLAREAGLAFTWDSGRSIGRIGPDGGYETSGNLPAPPTALSCSEDGKVIVAGGGRGQVWLLGPDLNARVETSLPGRIVSLALDPFGRYLAVADAAGGLHFLTLPEFRTVWKTTTARPLHHLAFIPEQPWLVGTADHGLVCAFDRKGESLWRDGLVSHVGSLSAGGDGATIVLACFSEGLICYSGNRGRLDRSPWPSPARLGVLSYTGEVVLIADLQGTVSLRDRDNRALDEWQPPAPLTALALSALGEHALAALADGQVVCLSTGWKGK
jgi:hypothetical protein